MKPNTNTISHLPWVVLLTALAFPVSVLAENIDSGNDGSRYAWSENTGWINFKPGSGPGVTVSDNTITGFAWAENIGWIKLDPPDNGVANDGSGNLSGFAWSENTGWINFAPPNGGVSINPVTGIFSGMAWGENIGWISFNTADNAVETSWRSAPEQTIFDLAARAKSGKVSLVWTPAANATGYNIYRISIAGGPYNRIASNIVTDYATYLDEGLVNGTTYSYVVTSIIAGTESAYSNEVSATPTARLRR